jgi:transposase
MEKTIKKKSSRKGIPIGRHDVKQRRLIGMEVGSGAISSSLAALKYNIPQRTVSHWSKLYSTQIALKAATPFMTEQEKELLTRLQAENEAMKKALSENQLKIISLETMIDIAEKELEIDIRKKPGTKQSNG